MFTLMLATSIGTSVLLFADTMLWSMLALVPGTAPPFALLLQQTPGGQINWTDQLPDLSTWILPLINWILRGLGVIGAIVLLWQIVEMWTQNPDRFSWFQVLWRALVVVIIITVASNSARILATFTVTQIAAP